MKNFLLTILSFLFFLFNYTFSIAQEEINNNIVNTEIINSSETFDDSVKIDNISEELSLDSIALTTNQQSGFELYGWSDSDVEFASLLIQSLPKSPSLPVLKKLQENLLITKIEPPANNTELNYFFNLRVKALSKMGASKSLEELVNKVPKESNPDIFKDFILTSYVMSGDIETTCNIIRREVSRSLFMQESILFCDMYFDQTRSLELYLEIMKEEGIAVNPYILETIEKYRDEENPKSYIEERWQKYLLTGKLSLEKAKYKILQKPKYINKSPFPTIHTLSWWSAVENLPVENKLQEISIFYKLLEQKNVVITYEEWKKLAEYALSNNQAIPEEALIKLLDYSVSKTRQTETICLILYALKDINKTPISANLWQKIISSLEKVNFSKDAKRIIIEGILSYNRVINYL